MTSTGSRSRLGDEDDVAQGLPAVGVGGQDGAPQLEQVLLRLHDDRVDAAVDEPARLFEEDPLQRVGRDVGEGRVGGGRQHAGGADRPGDEARMVVARVRLRRASGEHRGAEVHLVGAVAEPVLVELQTGGAEGVRLDDVAPDRVVAGVDGLDEVGSGEREEVVGALLPTELGGLELVALDLGPHGAVEHEYTAVQSFSEGHGPLSGQLALTSAARGATRRQSVRI
jgi:hypothetical protein